MGLTKLWGSLGLAVALIFGYLAWAKHQQDLGYQKAASAYQGKIDQQKKEAERTLKIETDKVTATEQRLTSFKNEQELTDAKSKIKVASLERDLRRATTADGRLRDPNATGCGGGGSATQNKNPTGPGNRLDDGSEAGGLFSTGASELLIRITREADEVNTAYASCRADAFKLREELK